MPPRQPLKLGKPRTKAPKAPVSKVAEVAAQLLAETAPAEARKPKLPNGFSPYPDLSMAIAMLSKRQQALLKDGERAKLLGRWLEQLQAMQKEMQKLHKLEQLAGRLSGKS
ncbi:MAG: hypothetical protein INF43_01075 [Alphaproteobacteria bacterium]|nr:hypothetical protein [Alphaproteobacteria bacterium]